MAALSGRCIGIHAQDPGLGKRLSRQFLQLLRPCAETGNIRGPAGGTELHKRNRIAAVMTYETAGSVKRQGNVTVGTFHRLPAGAAGNKIGIPPSVDEEHNLFLFSEPVLNQLLKPSAEHAFVAFLHLFP